MPRHHQCSDIIRESEIDVNIFIEQSWCLPSLGTCSNAPCSDHYESFWRATNFFIRDPDLAGMLFGHCRHFIYPPGCILTANGSGDTFLFIISRGYAQCIDAFGCKQVRACAVPIFYISGVVGCSLHRSLASEEWPR